MKKTWLVIGMAVVALWGQPVRARETGEGAWHGSRGHGMGMLPILPRVANLTPDQQAQMKAIFGSHRATLRSLAGQARAAEQELRTRLAAPGSLRADDLQPISQRLSQLRDQVSQERLAIALEVRALLTPDQLAKVAQFQQRFRELRSEMRALMAGDTQ